MSENTDSDENTPVEPQGDETGTEGTDPEQGETLGPHEHVVQLPDKQIVTGPHADEPPEYHRIVVADSKPSSELNTYERRAILLDRMEKAGHPRALPQSYQQIADEFGVAKSTVANDFERLSEYVAENLTREHHTIVDSVFRGAIIDLVEDGKKAWAAELAKEWYEWLADMGEVERVADKVDLSVDRNEQATEQYEIIEAEAVDSQAADDEDEAKRLPKPES